MCFCIMFSIMSVFLPKLRVAHDAMLETEAQGTGGNNQCSSGQRGAQSTGGFMSLNFSLGTSLFGARTTMSGARTTGQVETDASAAGKDFSQGSLSPQGRGTTPLIQVSSKNTGASNN
uniref:Uncharacterized protein n=1 Tax=Fibrocapsa japonica TaxID=94617 RepID=A0A7S2V0U1_9STRA|mmetsp:Transcript_23606/g.34327  ORF Transcript_23606/g.34327 Transcript_23606/m.34327 type:complete len:118 (+) Transcript_23606:3-356(+)